MKYVYKCFEHNFLNSTPITLEIKIVSSESKAKKWCMNKAIEIQELQKRFGREYILENDGDTVNLIRDNAVYLAWGYRKCGVE
jgi:hypothetical protein